jgi:cytochrome oxidase assembly protein ShyY1
VSLEALEFAVVVVASILILSIVYELAQWTLHREDERIDRHEREVIRRRYGRPPNPR